jgi:hypothetical protein
VDLVRGCAECLRLSESYEAETMSWFRLEGQLRIAEYGRDQNSVHRISADLAGVARRRTELRAAIEQHESEFHKDGSQAGPLTMRA